MATRSSKHQSMIPLNIMPTGGINVSLPATAIADNELVNASNFMYSPTTGRLVVRPGFSCVTTTPLTAAITNLHWYVKNATTSFLICSCSDDKIYYLDTDAWVEISSISTGQTPSFLTFNSKLLWADTTGIYSWDGVTGTITVTTITTAITASALYEIGGRVVANHSTEFDSVYFSGPQDETDWDTSSGGAIGLRAGYGDGLQVNAFSSLGTDLIVSKAGAGKCFYRVSTAGTATDWSTERLIQDAAADHSRMIAASHNDILFVDGPALRSLQGVQEYGDIQIANAGNKVNKKISDSYLDGNTAYFVRHLPSIDMVWIGHGGTVYIYHTAFGTFTTISLSGEIVTSVVDADGIIYAANAGGDLYKLDWDLDTDELTPGTTSDYETKAKSKEFRFSGGEGIVRRSEVALEAISAGVGVLEIVKAGGTGVYLKNITLPDPIDYLGDADGLLGDADRLLGDSGEEAWVDISRNRVRTTSFSVQFRTTSGRCGVESFNVLSAMVNG